MTKLSAQMSNSGGRWHLYVPLMNAATVWPEYDWARRSTVPTLAEREQALSALGYESAPDGEWTWVEDSDTPGDPTSPVRLIAAATIRPSTTGGAA
ncbi:DUF6303 family protein [Streptomyces sp. 900116325]